MKWLVTATARLIVAGQRAYVKKWSFLALFVLAFIGSITTLARLDLLPSSSDAPIASANEDAASSVFLTTGQVSNEAPMTPEIPEIPVKISIPVIGLSASISNPTTTEASILDKGLLSGAVRYPTSAKLGEDGNVVLFGHSSYLPIVSNQAYKTFNGIQKLTVGDTIAVFSADTVYTYAVRSVSKESVNDAIIPLSVTGRVLTLSTCDSFTVKTDRFIVVADFVESHLIRTS